MSKVVENQVVQMQFDNKEFEKNVSQSMQSLDDFKDKMDFKDASRSFDDLEKASRSIDFEKLNRAVDGVGEHFTLLGRIAYKVTDEIADYFKSKIVGAIETVKKMSIDMIDVKAGYKKYDEYVGGVKSILYALGDDQKLDLVSQFGSEIEGVEKYLEELMWYTDETSYNFTDMTNTIGKFMGAGISLESSVKDMEGLANWAALAGQNAATASQSMYQVSQALSRGYLQYMDWQQAFGTKNMGTTVAKDVLIDAAIKEGYIKDEDIAQAKKETGSDDRNVWRNYFFQADVLNKQMWLKTKVMETGLHEFSKSSDEMHKTIDHFTDEIDISATDLITALEHMKGKNVAQAVTAEEAAMYILGIDPEDKDAVKKQADDIKYLAGQLTILSDKEHELSTAAMSAAQKAYTFTDAVQATKDAVGTKFTGIFTELVGNAEEAAELWTGLSNSLWDIFAGPLDNIYTELKDNWGPQTVKALDAYGREMDISIRKHMWNGVGRVFSELGNAVSEIASAIHDAFVYIIKGPEALAEALSDDSDEAKKGESTVVKFFNKLTDAVHKMADAIKAFVESPTFKAITDYIRSFGNLLRPIFVGMGKVRKAILSGFGKTPEEAITNIFEALTNINMILAEAIDSLINSKGFNTALKIVTKTVKTLFGAFKSLIQFIRDLTSEDKTAKEAFDDLRESASKGIDEVVDFIKELTGIDLSWIMEKIKTFGGVLVGIAGGMATVWGNLNEKVFSKTPEAWDNMIEEMQNGSPGEKVYAVLEFLGGRLKDGLDAIIEAVEEWTGVDLTGFRESLFGFFDFMSENLKQMTPTFDAAWTTIGSLFKTLGSVFKDLADAIFTVIGQITGIENMGPDKILDLIFWILEKMVGIVIWLVNSAGKAIQAAGPYLEACGDMIANGFGKICKAFNYIVGIDKSPEALKALEDIKKALKVVITILLLLEAWKFFKAIKWFFESSANLADVITGRIVRQTTLQQITGLIKGIASIMIAIALLSNQDIGGIAMAVVSLGLIVKILIGALKKIMKEMMDFAAYVEALGIDDKRLATMMSKVNSMIGALGKLVTRVGIAVLLMSIADKIGGPMLVERSMLALFFVILALTKGTANIVKAMSSAYIDPKSLKQANKTLNQLTKSLLKIVVSVSLLAWALTSLFKLDSTAPYWAMGFLVVMVSIVSIGASLIIKAVQECDTTSLGNAAKIIGKLTTGMLVISGALWILQEVFKEAGLTKQDAIKIVGISLGVLAGVVLVLSLGMKLIALIAPKAKTSTDKASKALDKLAESLLKQVGKVTKLYTGFFLVISGLIAIVGAVALLTLINNFMEFEAVVAAVVEVVAILLAMWGLTKFIEKLNFSDKAVSNMLILGATIGMFVGAILSLTTALAVLTLVTQMPNIGPAVAALGIMAAGIIGFIAVLPLLASNTPAMSATALALMGLSGSIMVLTMALKMLTTIEDEEQLQQGLLIIGIFAAGLLALAGIVGLVPIIQVGMVSLASAFAAIGIGALALAAAVLVLSFVSDNIDTVVEKIDNLAANVQPLVDALLRLAIAMVDGLAQSILDNSEAIAASLVKAIGAILKLGWDLLCQLLFGWLDIGEWSDEILNFFAGIWEAILGTIHEIPGVLKDIWEGVKNGIGFALKFIAGLPLQILMSFLDPLRNLFGIHSPSTVMTDFGKNIILGLINGIKDMLKKAVDAILGVGKAILNGIKSLFGIHSPSTVFTDFGKNIIQGLINGIKNLASKPIELVKSMGKSILNGIKGIFGIHSPSTAMWDVAKNIIGGLTKGILDNESSPLNAIKKVGTDLLGAFMPQDSLVSALGMDQLTDSFKSMSFADFDFSSGLNEAYVSAQVTPDMYAFNEAMDGYSSVNAIGSIDWGDMGNADQFFASSEMNFSTKQMDQITGSYESGSSEIVKAIDNLSAQVEEQAKAITSMQIVLDTGVVVGELSGGIDSYLGGRARLNSRTGI